MKLDMDDDGETLIFQVYAPEKREPPAAECYRPHTRRRERRWKDDGRS